jgi:hypothetical protein
MRLTRDCDNHGHLVVISLGLDQSTSPLRGPSSITTSKLIDECERGSDLMVGTYEGP